MIKCYCNGDPEVGQIYDRHGYKTYGSSALLLKLLRARKALFISLRLAKERVAKVEDVVKEGDVVKVKVIEIDDKGRINLSIKDCLE